MIRLQQLKKVLPILNYQARKGSNGLVGVIGGSVEYTGAPFYSAMAAIRMGADLAHVFCHKQAATAIKSYSPELIVHPVFSYELHSQEKLNQLQFEEMATKWCHYFENKLQKINSWVLGPGLGRNKHFQYFIPKFIKLLPEKSNIVIDADGLFFLCKLPQLLNNLSKMNCVLTPNFTQFKHLNKILKVDEESLTKKYLNNEVGETSEQQQLKQFGKVDIKQEFLDRQIGMTVVIKGAKDLILHKGNTLSIVGGMGSKKRCGGIGDVLSGCISACINWNYSYGPILACHVTKLAALMAYEKHGRSLTGLGVLNFVEEALHLIEK